MNLAVDIGNSLVKAAVFDDGQAVETFRSKAADKRFFDGIFQSYPDIDAAILVSSGPGEAEAEELLVSRTERFLKFGPDVKVPIKNLYETPETLGCDRLAAAVGADLLYPESNILIVDFGTAITIDLVCGGVFRGGNISPGMRTRFRALHDYTSRLPECSPTDETVFPARCTTEAIEQGVMQGITYEIEGYIRSLTEKNVKISIIFTGGDAKYFVKRIKNAIFAKCELVICGLNRILDYNATEQADI